MRARARRSRCAASAAPRCDARRGRALVAPRRRGRRRLPAQGPAGRRRVRHRDPDPLALPPHLVLNRPEGILAANEKLYALHFPELMAETLVTRHIAELRRLHDEARRRDDREAPRRARRRGRLPRPRATTGTSTRSSSSRRASARAARWRSASCRRCAQGDKRILLLDGEPLGALLRVPSPRASCARTSTSAGARERADARPTPTAASSSASPRLRARRPLLRRHRRDRRPPHRDQRHQPDGDPGDGRASTGWPRGPGDRRGGGARSRRLRPVRRAPRGRNSVGKPPKMH